MIVRHAIIDRIGYQQVAARADHGDTAGTAQTQRADRVGRRCAGFRTETGLTGEVEWTFHAGKRLAKNDVSGLVARRRGHRMVKFQDPVIRAIADVQGRRRIKRQAGRIAQPDGAGGAGIGSGDCGIRGHIAVGPLAEDQVSGWTRLTRGALGARREGWWVEFEHPVVEAIRNEQVVERIQPYSAWLAHPGGADRMPPGSVGAHRGSNVHLAEHRSRAAWRGVTSRCGAARRQRRIVLQYSIVEGVGYVQVAFLV
jgi:hypothetical protein